jgi:sporulation and spore germination protein/immunoglobulin-like protein involved in spore germination
MKRHRAGPVLFVLLLVLGAAACGGGSGGLGTVPSVAPTPSSNVGGPDETPIASGAPSASASPSTEPSGEPSAAPSPAASAAATPRDTMIVRAYFVLGGEPGVTGLVPVLRTVPQSPGVAKAAMTALLAGPTSAEAADRTITTTIPDGTTLRGVSIRNGIATVDLSTEFDSGGGTASMRYRLAQVVYTLTQFSTVKSVVFQVEGQTVTVFGSEGILLEDPSKRADWADELPAMFVDRPAYGAAIGNPGPISGNADVFEAQFRLSILDGAGKVLVDQPVTASCGSGCRGTFQQTVGYAVGKAQWGTLRVYDPSEKDGSPQSVREYPVWLTPRP